MGSVFDMTEAKIPGSPDKVEDDELDQQVDSTENLNIESPDGSPTKLVAKKPRDDDLKLLHDGDRSDPTEIIEEGFVDIARVTAGCSFGELALIDRKPRMSSVKCLTRCHFLVLHKNDYLKTLKE